MSEMLTFEDFKARYQKVPVEEYPNRVRDAVPEPMVSVHVITYNHADYIREAIDSVLMQEADFPMEIVIGDDKSTDGTREICMEYAEQYPEKIRLMLHHRENNIELHGRPTHLFQYWYNTLSLRGKYIAVLSGDDYWTDPLKMQTEATFLESNPEYALSFHDSVMVDEKGKVIIESLLPEEKKRDFSKEDLLRGDYIPAVGVMFKNVFDQVPVQVTECIGEDRFSRAVAAQYGKAKYHQNIKPSSYRRHERGIFRGLNKSGRRKEILNTTISVQEYLKGVDKNHFNLTVCKLSSDMKAYYYSLVDENKYRSALLCFVKICFFDCKNKLWVDVIRFMVNGSRFLAGNVRRLCTRQNSLRLL